MFLGLFLVRFSVAPTVALILLLLQQVVEIMIHVLVAVDMDILVCGGTRALK